VYNVQFLSDGKRISISTEQPACQIWDLFDENNLIRPSIRWSSSGPYLSAQQTDIKGVKGLSESNQKVLLQHGAIDHSPAIKDEKKQTCVTM
jgi:hypothetical protein